VIPLGVASEHLYAAKADATVTSFPAGVQRRTDETRNFAQR
jgi:hypothetical protein